MLATQQFLQEIESIKKRRSQAKDDISPESAQSGGNYNTLLNKLIERAKERTCSQCELMCGDNTARTGYSDLPTFYCEAFCDAYFAEADILNLGLPVERELWARARMWKAHLLHTPLWINHRINGAIYGDEQTPYSTPY